MVWPLPLITGESTTATLASRVVPAILELRANEASGTEPAAPTAYQFWMNTSTGRLNIRNSANSAWIDVFGLTAGGVATRQSLEGWYQDNVVASQTDVALSRAAAGAFPTVWVAPRAGSILGVTVLSNDARAAGTLTVQVWKNGVATGLTAVLDGVNTTFKATVQAAGTDTFTAGDHLDVRITTDAGWLPITADIRAAIEVEM
jgi:hypothetical protein